jgi:hypothetical protein
MEALLIGIVGVVLLVGMGGALADAIAAVRPVPGHVTPGPVPGRTLPGFDALQHEVDRLSAGLRTTGTSRSGTSGA